MTLTADIIPLPEAKPGESVAEAQAQLRATLVLGEADTCACCGGYTKVYARKLHVAMARVLRALNDKPLTPREMSTIAGGGGDGGKLAHWGLIEQRGGVWIIAPKGKAFLRGDVCLPHRVLIYQGSVIGFDTSKMIRISDILPDVDIERDVMSEGAVAGAWMA